MGVIVELILCESGFFDHIHWATYTENGDIVVAMLKGEVTVKWLFIRDEEIALRPENPDTDRSRWPRPWAPHPRQGRGHQVIRFEDSNTGNGLAIRNREGGTSGDVEPQAVCRYRRSLE